MKRLVTLVFGLALCAAVSGCCCFPCCGSSCGYGGCGPGGCPAPGTTLPPTGMYAPPACSTCQG